MQIEITDLLTLESYVSTLKERVEGITDYKYLGAGEEFDDAIQSYFNNKYQSGITLFLGIFESMTREAGGKQSFAPVFCQVCVLTKADPRADLDTLVARNDTWIAALKLVGTIEQDMEDSTRMASVQRLRVEVNGDKLIPLERVANVNAWGWGTELVFSIPVNSIKFS
jgi:hypothetical protein